MSQSGVTLISGSIGLVPGTMTLLSQAAAAQAGLALRHVSRVARVLSGDTCHSAARAVCYVTCIDAARQALHTWRTSEDTNKDLQVQCVMVNQLPRGAEVEWEVEIRNPNCDNGEG